MANKFKEGTIGYYTSGGSTLKQAQTKVEEYKKAQELAKTIKSYEDAQKAKVNPFNPMDEFQKFLDSKDDTYWKGVEATASEKVNPYYDKIKSQLAEQLGIDQSQLNLKKEQNETAYQQDIGEIARMTTYAKDEFARNMGKTDRAFASTIQRASEAYGQRGLLNSGVQAYGNLISAKDQQSDKASMQAGIDKTITDLEESRKKAFSQYDLSKKSLWLTEQELALKNEQNKDKLARDKATELEVARANTDERITERAIGDIASYAQQRGAISSSTTPVKTATISGVKTLAKKATKRFATPLLN